MYGLQLFLGRVTARGCHRAHALHLGREVSKHPSSPIGLSRRPWQRVAWFIRPYADSVSPPTRRSLHESRASSGRAETTTHASQIVDEEGSTAPDVDLPSQAERRRGHLSRRFNQVMDQAQSNLILASQQLNDLTGYSGIESLKRAIEDQEAHVQRSRASVRAAKDVYTAAIATRSASQREVNELLQRKHAWTPTDLERFTALYRSDHANEHAEAAAGRRLAEAEQAADEQATELTRSILARYHEEQIWSDKIRRMSTWGTWGLMGVNVLLFVLFQVAVEPWRRARLIQGFDDKVRDALEREKLAATAANEEDRPVNTLLPSNAADPASTPLPSSEEGIHTEADADPLLPLPHDPPPPTILAATQVTIADLFSPRVVSLRKVDVTAAVLEGAAAGATFMGIAILLVMGVGRG